MPARAVTAAAALAAAGLALAAAAVPASAARAAGSGGNGGCGASGYAWGYGIACASSSSVPAAAAHPARAAGTGGSRPAVSGPPPPPEACALYPIAGNPGHMLQVCNGEQRPPGVRNTVYGPFQIRSVVPRSQGAPAVTARQLLAWAQAQLSLPLPQVRTSPPVRCGGRPRQCSGGLTGLPERFWVPAGQWRPRTARVQAGGAWAQVTASPAALEVSPGDGSPGLACDGAAATTPGDCAHDYSRSSAGLPGSAYTVTVTVIWQASWRGSGGADGTLDALRRTTAVTLPVGEGQGLITSTGN